MSPHSPQLWFSILPQAIIWREWEGEFVVRDERSGSTHHLAPLAGRVLLVLLQAGGGVSVPDIVNRLGDQPAPADEPEWGAAIDAVLSEFQRLGLVGAEPQ
jgi:PqqD family protein of HPr-rel-A system